MPATNWASERPVCFHDRQHLQGAYQAVAGRGAVEAQQVTGGFPAQNATFLAQQTQHVAVTDVGAAERNTEIPQRLFEPEIAHEGPDDGPAESSFILPGTGQNVQQLVAIDQAPEVIDHDQPVAVAIQRDADIGARCQLPSTGAGPGPSSRTPN
jgi:hypothetical protein